MPMPTPTTSTTASTTFTNARSLASPLPYSLYDVVLDLPHPGCSESRHNSKSCLVVHTPPTEGGGVGVGVVDRLSSSSLLTEFGPEDIGDGGAGGRAAMIMGLAKVARFAFPEYDDVDNASRVSDYAKLKSDVGWSYANSNELNRNDAYFEEMYSPVIIGSIVGTMTPSSVGASMGGGGDHASSVVLMTNGITVSASSSSSSPSSRRVASRLPSCHSFSHRLFDGTVVHGHVRRYLPSSSRLVDDSSSSSTSSSAIGRRDVGRRSPRALVILTRNSGGGHRTYGAMLRIMEAMALLGGGDAGGGGAGAGMRLRRFLHDAYAEHVRLCRSVSIAVTADESRGAGATSGSNDQSTTQANARSALAAPRTMTLSLVEIGGGGGGAAGEVLFGTHDEVRIIVPASFLNGNGRSITTSTTTTTTTSGTTAAADLSGLARNDVMPMLRCLGPARALRLLSAIMSERRVILACRGGGGGGGGWDAGRLSAVAYGAASMAGQGMMPSFSGGGGTGTGTVTLFVPVLPPGLRQLLQTPSAYLIGILVGSDDGMSTTSCRIGLPAILNDIQGEVVVFDLDAPPGVDPYFHNMPNPRMSVPDITHRNVDDLDMMSASERSIADNLHRDLAECLRSDRKLFWQGAVQEKLGMAAAKTKTAAVGAMKKGMKFLKAKSSLMGFDTAGGEDDGGDNVDDDVDVDGGAGTGAGGGNQSRSVGRGNYAYEGGFSNEKSEEDARIAFATFFVCLYGDVRTYLTQPSPGAPPVVDREKFMRHRAQSGDVPGSGMFLLAGNFLRSGVFDAFAEARREEVMMARPVSEDAPLFALVTNRHRMNRIDFSTINVRNSVRQVATHADFPGRYLIDWNVKVRDRVSQLTSAQAYGGDFARDVMQLAEDCRESGAVLVDTMMILWTRMQEGRGMQWKKAHLALLVLRGLLLYGPISAITETMDGFASVRILNSYTETLRGQNAKLVRDVASEIRSFLVDTPLLFARRRECMNVRRIAKDPRPSPLRKETRMISGIKAFRNIHLALRPTGVAVAPAPADLFAGRTALVVSVGAKNHTGAASGAAQSVGYSDDLLLLSMFPPTSAPQATSANNAVFVGQEFATSCGPQPGKYSSDLLALSLGSSPPSQLATASNEERGGEKALVDPFSMHEMIQAARSTGQDHSISAGSYNASELKFGASSSPKAAATSNDRNVEALARVDPFSIHEMNQATLRTGPSTANEFPFQKTQSSSFPSTTIAASAGNSLSTPSRPSFQLMANGPVPTHIAMLQPTQSTQPYTIASTANSHHAHPVQHSQNIMRQSPMPTQSLSLSPVTAINNMQVPSYQQMQQKPQPVSPVSNLMSIPPAQGRILPVNYHQPQQAWPNAAPGYALNGPDNSTGYPMMQGAPQFQQGGYSQASSAPPKPPM